MAKVFYYTARDSRGTLICGSLQAGTPSDALAHLRTRALFVTSLASAGGARGALAAALQVRTVSRGRFAALFRALWTLIRAGVPMARALEVTIAQCTDSGLREALQSVLHDIGNGLALSDAMARRPREFPRLFVSMVRAGELGGALDEVLERIADVLERERAMRKRLAAALTYPLIVACAALFLVVFLVTTIVPMFDSMYEQLHVPLPGMTAALIALGTALRSPLLWLAIALCAACACAAALRIRHAAGSRSTLESLLLSMPVAGVLMKKSNAGRLARLLGTLLRCGVGLAAALEIVPDVMTSVRYAESVRLLRAALREGSTIGEPLARSGLYEPVFIQMVRVGEETGTLDTMLLRIADYYDLDCETMLTALSSMVEPAMILLLGGAVGFIVAAIFIPLYTLIGNIR